MIYTLLIKDCNSCPVCPFNDSTAVPSVFTVPSVPMVHSDSLFPRFQDVGGVFFWRSNTLLSYNWLINACIGCLFDCRPVCIGCPVMFYPHPVQLIIRTSLKNINQSEIELKMKFVNYKKRNNKMSLCIANKIQRPSGSILIANVKLKPHWWFTYCRYFW